MLLVKTLFSPCPRFGLPRLDWRARPPPPRGGGACSKQERRREERARRVGEGEGALDGGDDEEGVGREEGWGGGEVAVQRNRKNSAKQERKRGRGEGRGGE